MGSAFVCFCNSVLVKKKNCSSLDFRRKFENKMLTRGATRALLGLRAAAKQQMVPVRNFRYETVVSGPPRTPISTAEKIIHFSVICVAFFATPAYILANIKNYRGLEGQ